MAKKGTEPTEQMGRERDPKIEDVTLEIEGDTKTAEEVTKFAEFSCRSKGRNGLSKVLLLVLALCGFGLSIAGVLQLRKDHCECESAWLDRLVCDMYGFQWWALGFEAFVLVCVGLADVSGVAKEVYAVLTGLLLFASMQICQAGWYDSQGSPISPRAGPNLMGTGFALLYGVNIYVAGCLGLARCSQSRSESNGVWNGVWLRIVGFVVAGVGILGMVAKVVADTCEDKCEDNWWTLAQHSFVLLLFISTQIVAKIEAFKPMLTVLLAIRIRSWELDLGNTEIFLAKVGLVVTIISAYLLILMCMESQMKDDRVECGGSYPAYLRFLSFALLLTVVICSALDFYSAEDHGPLLFWILASRYLAFDLWYVWLRRPLNSLPVVAFLALAIYNSPLRTHNWLTKGQGLAFRGVSNLILTIVVLFLMMMMGARKKLNN